MVQDGRNFKTCVVIIFLMLNKGMTNSSILREMDSLIIFPHSFDRNKFNTLIDYLGIDKMRTKGLYELDERFF
jgi:hypothetical protein